MTDSNTTRSFLRGVASAMVFCAEHPEPLEGAEQFLTQVVDVPLLAFDASHLGVPAIKLASEDLINGPLLDMVAGRNVPVILSTGM
ncbi:MAG TPA: hypothetical protein EYO82_07850, partial [Gammaproteobacteria bacterium]|nr:hypothetical protein [Gammaproteobacteria bacterium]